MSLVKLRQHKTAGDFLQKSVHIPRADGTLRRLSKKYGFAYTYE